MSDETEFDTDAVDISELTPATELHRAAAALPALAPVLREMASYQSRLIRATLIGDMHTADQMEARLAEVAEQCSDDDLALIASVLEGGEPPTVSVLPDLPAELPEGHKALDKMIDDASLDVSKSLKLEAKADGIADELYRKLVAAGEIDPETHGDDLPGYLAAAAARVEFETESVREKARVGRDEEPADAENGEDDDVEPESEDSEDG